MIGTILILLLLAVVGGLLAFDVQGAATRLREQAHSSVPFRRERVGPKDEPLNMAKVIGWIFFIVGAGGLLLAAAAGIVSILRGS